MRRSDPKIIYNEEYIDLREQFGSAMNSHLIRNENKKLWKEHSPVRKIRNDKNQVVNTALKKLAKRYNSNVHGNDNKLRPRIRENSFDYPNSKSYRVPGYQDNNSLKSKSELVNLVKEDRNNSKIPYPSSPAIQRSYEKEDFIEKVEPFKNKFTMTKPRKTRKNEISKVGKNITKEKSLEKLIDNLLTEKPSRLVIESCKNPVWKDQRLAEKYSLLKVPWKRSYTLPIYPSQPSIILKEEFHKRLQNYSDKKTYPYDDGSDIDSMFLREPSSIQQYFGYTFQSQVLALLNVSAYLCAILILSLIIWIISGNKLFYQLFLPKPPEHPVKKSVKYVGGAIIHTISSIIKFLGSIFVIPTQQVYHPADEYSWPP